LVAEIFGGIIEGIFENLIPSSVSFKKRKALIIILTIAVCALIIAGICFICIAKYRILGIILLGISVVLTIVFIAVEKIIQKNAPDRMLALIPITEEIYESKVYPIHVKYRYRKLLTLTYYTEKGDGIIHSEKNLLWFTNVERIREFCKEFKLNLDYDDKEEICTFDYDENVSDPIDFNEVLCNWNLLNTMATSLKMEFEGDKEKYSELYDLLFRLCTPAEPTERTTYEVGKKNVSTIRKLFKNILLYFDKFEYYR